MRVSGCKTDLHACGCAARDKDTLPERPARRSVSGQTHGLLQPRNSHGDVCAISVEMGSRGAALL